MDLDFDVDIDERPETAGCHLSTKLLHRFYEALGLLFALGKTRGEHTHGTLPSHEQVDSFSALELKRQFLNELAFLCDYKKGGDTVTAIALGQTPQECVFWVAANKCPKKSIIPFLTGLLLLLKQAGGKQHDQSLSEQIFKLSVTFARARIVTYARFLSTDLDSLLRFPAYIDAVNSSSITAWKAKLGTLDGENLHSLVRFAYKERHSTFMRGLAAFANERHYKSSRDSLQAICASARHHIGRLGLHARSARALALYTPRAMTFLDSYSIQSVIVPGERNVRPPLRGKTTVDAALGRMVPNGDLKLETYRRALSHMDPAFNISERFRKDYGDVKNKTRVHAEVQVLHHFDLNGGEFEGNDKYIACSKPACFCCLLYFRHHPGGYAEPRSHHKIYLNWQPPGVSEAANSEERTRVKTILNLMVQDIRTDALGQIDDKAGPRRSHPDSLTGISASVLAIPGPGDISDASDSSREPEGSSSGGIGDDSFGSDNADTSSALSQPVAGSATDDEEGGISLL